MEHKELIGKIISTLEKKYDEVSFAFECPDNDKRFYFVARKGDTQIEIYTQPVSNEQFEIWYLDDFGADNENGGDWMYKSKFMLLSDVFDKMKSMVSDDYPLVIEQGLVLDDEALEHALLDIGYKEEDIQDIPVVEIPSHQGTNYWKVFC